MQNYQKLSCAIGQSGGFIDRFLGPVLKPGLTLIRNVFRPLAKSVLILSVLQHVRIRIIYKKKFGSGTTTLIISNAEMNDIMNLDNSFEESGS